MSPFFRYRFRRRVHEINMNIYPPRLSEFQWLCRGLTALIIWLVVAAWGRGWIWLNSFTAGCCDFWRTPQVAELQPKRTTTTQMNAAYGCRMGVWNHTISVFKSPPSRIKPPQSTCQSANWHGILWVQNMYMSSELVPQSSRIGEWWYFCRGECRLSGGYTINSSSSKEWQHDFQVAADCLEQKKSRGCVWNM